MNRADIVLLNHLLNHIDQKLENIIMTQEEAATQLQAVAAQLALDAANQAEALAELGNHTVQITALQTSIDALTAEIAAGAPITPTLQTALDNVVAAAGNVSSSAAALAAIVPNAVPVVDVPVVEAAIDTAEANPNVVDAGTTEIVTLATAVSDALTAGDTTTAVAILDASIANAGELVTAAIENSTVEHLVDSVTGEPAI